jgi:hypothetical protein
MCVRLTKWVTTVAAPKSPHQGGAFDSTFTPKPWCGFLTVIFPNDIPVFNGRLFRLRKTNIVKS